MKCFRSSFFDSEMFEHFSSLFRVYRVYVGIWDFCSSVYMSCVVYEFVYGVPYHVFHRSMVLLRLCHIIALIFIRDIALMSHCFFFCSVHGK